MTLHLIKLSVGSTTFSDLEAWQTQRLNELARNHQQPELMHVTRHMPKRAQEVLDGGSIYWVIKGSICARQRLLEFRPLQRDGIPHCGLIYDTALIRVQPRPRRAFQGWRYFDPNDAPPDVVKGQGFEEMPEEMLRELAELGLL